MKTNRIVGNIDECAQNFGWILYWIIYIFEIILMTLGLFIGNNNGIGLTQTKISVIRSQIDLILLEKL